MHRVRTATVVALGLLAACGTALLGQGPGPAPAASPATAFLAGQVVDDPSGRPIPQAQVFLQTPTGPPAGRGRQPPVIADSQGRFFFGEVPAGTFSLSALKPGYNAAGSNSIARPIELREGERILDVKLRLARLASLSGTVRDDGGDPVVGTTVVAVRRTLVNGRMTPQPIGRATTDDRGLFRIEGLRPGEYVLCACSRDPIPLDGRLLTSLAAEPLQLLGVAARALMVGGDVVTLDDTLRTYAPAFY